MVAPKPGEEEISATIVVPFNTHAPSVARQFVEDHKDHLDETLLGEAKLLVSELVTNALRHGEPEIVLRLRLNRTSIGIEVADEGSLLPPSEPIAPPIDQPNGRGLLIVEALSKHWGITTDDSSGGKTVWFGLEQ